MSLEYKIEENNKPNDIEMFNKLKNEYLIMYNTQYIIHIKKEK